MILQVSVVGDPGRWKRSGAVGGSADAARESNEFGPRRGSLALTTSPVPASAKAYARSPSRPRPVTSAALGSSPIVDSTGYRQIATTRPDTVS
jgi:hypothetical protein